MKEENKEQRDVFTGRKVESTEKDSLRKEVHVYRSRPRVVL